MKIPFFYFIGYFVALMLFAICGALFQLPTELADIVLGFVLFGAVVFFVCLASDLIE